MTGPKSERQGRKETKKKRRGEDKSDASAIWREER